MNRRFPGILRHARRINDAPPSPAEADSSNRASPLYTYTAYAQAIYYTLTGIWALVGLRSFERVTGPKTDKWLVKTVGVLVTVIGLTLGLTGYRRRRRPEVTLLAAGSALSLASIDITYVAKGRISRIYLLDAVAELALALVWGVASLKRRRSPARRSIAQAFEVMR